MKKDKTKGSWKKAIPHMVVFFGSILFVSFGDKILNFVPENQQETAENLLMVVWLAALFLIFVSGYQMVYHLLTSSPFSATDFEVNGMYHDIAKPDPDFIEEDQKLPVHETVLSQYVVESLVFQPKLQFTITFKPETDKCTFLLSNGYSCTAEAEVVPENNYYIKWHTLSWNAPLSDRLSKEDKRTVALALAELDKDTIVWPFSDRKLTIMATRFSYH